MTESYLLLALALAEIPDRAPRLRDGPDVAEVQARPGPHRRPPPDRGALVDARCGARRPCGLAGGVVVTAPAWRPTREQLDGALRAAADGHADHHDARVLAAEVRACHAERELLVKRLLEAEDKEIPLLAELDDLRAELVARTPHPAEPTALMLAAEQACVAIGQLDPDATEGVAFWAVWNVGPGEDYVPEEIERALAAGRALMAAIDEATGRGAPQPAVSDDIRADLREQQ